MKELNKEILLRVEGGLNISGAVISSFTKAIDSVMNLGRCLGTSIRRITSGNLC